MAGESQLQAKIIKDLKKRGAYVVKVIVANDSGTPDILMCYKGMFFGIEVKNGSAGRLSKLQEKRLGQITMAGGRGLVIKSYEEYLEVFRE